MISSRQRWRTILAGTVALAFVISPLAAALSPSVPDLPGGLPSGRIAPSLISPPSTSILVPGIAVGTSPQAWGFSPYNGSIYITNSATTGGGNNMTMINATTNKVALANIPLTGANEPIGVAIDPASNELFVAQYNGADVVVLNATTNAYVGLLSPSSATTGSGVACSAASQLLVNPTTNLLYIGCRGASYLGVYHAAGPLLNKFDMMINVSANPYGITLAPVNSTTTYLATSSITGTAVTIINATTNVAIRNITNSAWGTSPIKGMAYDESTNTLYATVQSKDFLAMINPKTYAVSSSVVPVGTSPNQVAYDPSDGDLYVANSGSNNVSVVSATTNKVVATVAVGSNPLAVGYDAFNSDLYVVNQNSNNVTVIAGGAATKYPVTLTERGLPAGTSWSVTVGGVTTTSATASLVVSEANGTYSYTVGSVTNYLARGGSFVVAGAAVAVNVPYARAWIVTFVESNLPAGTSWSVALNGTPGSQSSTSSSIGFTLLNATYTWSVGAVPGYTVGAGNWTGSVAVTGANRSESVVWKAELYAVSFTETGLTPGTSWSVTLASTTNSSSAPGANVFREPNGTYSFAVGTVASYAQNLTSGTLTVSAGAVARIVAYTYSPNLYSLTFTEGGLGAGTSWTVTLNGSAGAMTSTSSAITFRVYNAVYTWTITPIAGYTTSPWSSTVTVSGGGAAVPVTFRTYTFAATFSEVGLPPGWTWYVNLTTGPAGFALPSGGFASAAGSISFSLVNGTYGFLASTNDPAYRAVPASLTTVTLTVASPAETVHFAGSNGVSVLVPGIPVGTSPQDWGLGIANDSVFVTNSASDNLTVISGATNKVATANVPVSVSEPIGVVADPASHEIYVAGYLSGSIGVLNSTTYASLPSIPLSGCMNPSQLLLDPVTNILYVGCRGGSTVQAFYTTGSNAGRLDTVIPVGAGPYGLAYVPLNATAGIIAVSSITGAMVSLINGTTNANIVNITSSVFVGYLKGMAYVPATGTLYVVDQLGGSTSAPGAVALVDPFTWAVNPTEIPVGTTPNQITYDAANGDLYVGNSASNNVTVIDAANNTVIVPGLGVGSTPFSLGFNPMNDEVYVVNENSNNVTVLSGGPPQSFAVTFSESTLPLGSSWTVAVGSVTNSSTGRTNTLYLPNGTYAYTLSGAPGYLGTPGTFAVAGRGLGIAAAFAKAWTISFDESGLPAGTAWTVTLNGSTPSAVSETSTASTITFTVLNATYSWAVTPIAAYSVGEGNWSGTLHVAASDLAVALRWRAVTYAATFTESGLANGITWYVNLSGKPSLSAMVSGGEGHSIVSELGNGSYSYTVGTVHGYDVSPSSGSFTIAAASVSEAIAYTAPYSITFTETGLPGGMLWTVSLGGVPNSSRSDAIRFTVLAGTYAYSVGALSGWAASNYTGTITIGSHNATESIGWTQVEYTITLTETGLAVTTGWSATVGLLTGSASAPEPITFTVPNGTYPYAITPVGGYATAPWSGSLTVSGSAVTLPVAWSEVVYAVTFNETGLPSGTGWSVTAGASTLEGTTAALTTSEANGSYGYSVHPIAGYRATKWAGTVAVEGGPVEVTVTFELNTYSITFVETGLPAGTSWGIEVGGLTYHKTSSSFSVSEPNGSVPYTVLPAPGYSTAWNGTVSVSGAAVTQTLVFSPFAYAVSFDQVGLASGTNWSVTVSGIELSSTGASISFGETNGTYAYTVGVPGGYTTNESGGVVAVDGHDAVVALTFQRVPSTAPSTILGLSPTVFAVVVGVIVVLGVAVVGLGVVRRRSRGSEETDGPEAARASSLPPAPQPGAGAPDQESKPPTDDEEDSEVYGRAP